MRYSHFAWSCEILWWVVVACLKHFLDHFAWLCEINSNILLSLQHSFSPLVQFTQSCEIFAWSCEFATYGFWAPLSFLSFSSFDSKLAASNQPKCWSKLIALLLPHHPYYSPSSIRFTSFATQCIKITSWNDSKPHKNH